MRPIDADALRQRMYHEAFETDTDMQKWDSGCWIRYKLFENCLESMPTVSPDDVRGVVHCCNCYHAEPRNLVGEKTEIFCRLFIAGMREDDFCSRGEFLTNCGARMKGAGDETLDNP